MIRRHREERSDEAIQRVRVSALDCFASLAMTRLHESPCSDSGYQVATSDLPVRVDRMRVNLVLLTFAMTFVAVVSLQLDRAHRQLEQGLHRCR